jgi:hypothetical protein
MARNGSVRPARHTLTTVLVMLAVLFVVWVLIA